MKMKTKWILCASFTFLALLQIVLVLTVDRTNSGINGTAIGFTGLNLAFFNLTGENETVYKITEIVGLIPFPIGATYAIVGLVEWIKRKDIRKVDVEILALALIYVLLGVFYLLFNKVAINYRPVLEGGAIEPSFPSSHTLLACVTFTTAIFPIKKLISNRTLSSVLQILCIVLAVVVVIGRLISGVHWFTDIVGALLFSGALIFLYVALISPKESKDAKQ